MVRYRKSSKRRSSRYRKRKRRSSRYRKRKRSSRYRKRKTIKRRRSKFPSRQIGSDDYERERKQIKEDYKFFGSKKNAAKTLGATGAFLFMNSPSPYVGMSVGVAALGARAYKRKQRRDALKRKYNMDI